VLYEYSGIHTAGVLGGPFVTALLNLTPEQLGDAAALENFIVIFARSHNLGDPKIQKLCVAITKDFARVGCCYAFRCLLCAFAEAAFTTGNLPEHRAFLPTNPHPRTAEEIAQDEIDSAIIPEDVANQRLAAVLNPLIVRYPLRFVSSPEALVKAAIGIDQGLHEGYSEVQLLQLLAKAQTWISNSLNPDVIEQDVAYRRAKDAELRAADRAQRQAAPPVLRVSPSPVAQQLPSAAPVASFADAVISFADRLRDTRKRSRGGNDDDEPAAVAAPTATTNVRAPTEVRIKEFILKAAFRSELPTKLKRQMWSVVDESVERFVNQRDIVLAWRETYGFVTANALFDNSSRVRQKVMTNASAIYAVRLSNTCTWVIAEPNTTTEKVKGSVSSRTFMTRASFEIRRSIGKPAAANNKQAPPAEIDPAHWRVVQTTAQLHAIAGKVIVLPNDSKFVDRDHKLVEYLVHEAYLTNELAATKLTAQPLNHVIGVDKSACERFTFEKKIGLLDIHNVLCQHKCAGRVTRQGQVLSPYLSGACMSALVALGGVDRNASYKQQQQQYRKRAEQKTAVGARAPSVNFTIRHREVEAAQKQAAADERKKKIAEEKLRLPKKLVVVRADDGVMDIEKDGVPVVKEIKEAMTEENIPPVVGDWKLLVASPFALTYAVSQAAYDFGYDTTVRGTWLVLDHATFHGLESEEVVRDDDAAAASGGGGGASLGAAATCVASTPQPSM
jgi:hypothetical protein